MFLSKILAGLLVFALVPAAGAITIDFEGIAPFTAPGASIPGLVISPDGAVLDEAGVSLVTGLLFPAGTVATSGVNVLANFLGATLTITFTTPVTSVSVETVGSIDGAVFGTITMQAFDGATLVGTASSDPLAIGDSGVPEATLGIGSLPSITSILFTSDVGGASSFALDDLSFTPVPEAGTGALLLMGVAMLLGYKRGSGGQV